MRYGNTWALRPKIGLTVYFTCDVELARYMLQKNQRNYNKSELQTRDLAKYIGHGLLTSNGDQWKRNRKLIQPAFYKKNLAEVIQSMASAVRDRLAVVTTDSYINIFPVMNELAFQVVARSLFNLQDTDQDMRRLQDITEAAQNMLVKEMRLQWLKWYFKRESLSRKNSIPYHLRQVEVSRQILKELIINRRTKSGHYQNTDLLDILMASTYEDGSSMNDEHLIDELLVIFTAGHETTANALSFAVQLLAHHPEIQEQAREEAFDSSEMSGDELMAAIRKATYITQCIEETMRLYPPAYFTDRTPVADDTYGDMKLDKGTTWLISFYEIHRRPDLWEDPDSFKPDRFANGRSRALSDQYFPFGAGSRMCVGNNFAMFEMVLVIAHLLKHYRWTPMHEKIDYLPLITLKPKNAQVKFNAL